MKARYAAPLVIVATFAAIPTSNAQTVPPMSGHYSLRGTGTVAVCFDPSFNPEACNPSGANVHQAMGTDLGEVTWFNGHWCATYTNVQVLLPLGPPNPPILVNHDYHLSGHVTKYDSTTGTGNNEFTTYNKGGTCRGENFEPNGPDGPATVFAKGTEHFVVREDGNWLDFVLTTLQTTPIPSLGSFSFTGAELKQNHP